MKNFFLLSLILISTACSSKNLRELAAVERAHNVELWEKCLTEHSGVGEKLSQHQLENLYLSSLDEEDFMEHLLKFNPGAKLTQKEDYQELESGLLNLKESLQKNLKSAKSKSVSSLLVILAKKVQEEKNHQFGQ